LGVGDEIMVAGQCRVLQETDQRKVRVLYEKKRWHAIWNHNPRIAVPDEQGDFQELRARDNYLRPYMVEKTATKWTWREYRPPLGEIYFNKDEREFGRRYVGRLILEPHVKPGASPNKQWGWKNWNKLCWILQEKHGKRVTQLGPLGTPIMDRVEHVITDDFRRAAAVLAEARAAVVHEGGIHHAAAALGIPSVVIFGSFIAPAVTGYESQVNIFTGEGLGCGMRLTCDHCKTALAKIKPEYVAEQLMELMRVSTPKHLAA
jgi:hypothetical protein